MLTDETKARNRDTYIRLLEMIGLNTPEFLDYLNSINYFEAPATAQYTGAYAGGLCEYALKLAHELGVLCNAYFPGKYLAEDVLKVALLKDIYRSCMYVPYRKNVKNEETGQWETVAAYKTTEDRPVYGDLGFSSFMVLRNYVHFTDEQLEAIIHSTGLNTYSVDIHEVLKKYKLVALTRMADSVVTNFRYEEQTDDD
jgi:hypothetical protein